jgi:hypothetical protein
VIDDILVGARFLGSVPGFMRHPVSLDEARATVQRRLAHRVDDFLDQARTAIYDNASSPYRALLLQAGCEYGDLTQLVRSEGLEAALRALLRQGVYLAVDEFKGRRPLVRGSATIPCNPALLRNPNAVFHLPVQTSGSGGQATVIPVDLASVRERAVNSCLALASRGGTDWVKAHWQVPGAGAVARIMEFGMFGHPPERWFSQVDPAAPGLHPRYRWSARAMQWGSRLGGRPLPGPHYVPVDNPLPVARWMAATLHAGRTPHLFTFVSSAVRLCQTALRAGINLQGAKFTLTGEPLTDANLSVIRRAGAEALPRYAVMECGVVGFGCQAPQAADDAHFPEDLHALVQPGEAAVDGPLPANALLLTSLRSAAPFVMLNVSMGDVAEVAPRTCGCPLEQLGWTTHLHTIRSHEKLTAAGMTFLDVDVVQVLEEVLPTRFGGGPTDFQLVEDVRPDGQLCLRLLVHPAIGPLDTEAVLDTFLRSIGGGSGAERIMAEVWRDDGLVRVERSAPLAGASGKILHVRPARPALASAERAS